MAPRNTQPFQRRIDVLEAVIGGHCGVCAYELVDVAEDVQACMYCESLWKMPFVRFELVANKLGQTLAIQVVELIADALGRAIRRAHRRQDS